MKIGYLCADSDVDLFGHDGCSVHIREFTNALVRAGHDVFIIAAWAHGEKPGDLLARVHTLQSTPLNRLAWTSLDSESVVVRDHLDRDLRSMLWNTWLQVEGASIIEQERPDFIYERVALFGWGGTELCRRFALPLVLELNAPLRDQQAEYHKFVLQHTAAEVERAVLQGADAVIALTGWLCDWAIDQGVDPQRIHVLPDAVSSELFREAPDGHDVRQRYDWTGNRVIGFVGSFHWWHDVALLVDAFARVYAEHPDARLLLVGGGEKRDAVHKRVRSLGIDQAVRFTGKVAHHQVPEHIAAMDVAVVPYRQIKDFYFSPLKLFESMAMGRPTVAAALGQIAEMIEHGKNGLLYQPGSVEDLAAGLRVCLTDRESGERMGQAARQQVLSRHTWEAVTRRVVEIVRAIRDDSTREVSG